MRRYFAISVLLFLFVFVAVNSCIAQSELIFPVIASTWSSACGTSCEYWTFSPSVFNPNDQPVTVTFTTYDSNGNIIASGAVAAGAFQSAIMPPSVGSLRTGWLKVTGTQPIVGREYLEFFRVSARVQDLRSKIYLSPAPLSKSHFIRPEAFGSVGISIVFPSAANEAPTRGKLIHRETDGSTVSEKELVIGPNGQMTGYLRDLLSPASLTVPVQPLMGSFEIVFDQEVAVTALQFAASEPLEENVEALTGAIPSQ